MSTEDNALFDLDSVKMDSPRLVAIKEHDIQTHHAPHCEDPWMAIPMGIAREEFKDYEDEENKFTDCASITASVGILLEEAGMLFTGYSQREVEDAALAFVESLANKKISTESVNSSLTQ